ncbi:MAG: tRNA-binding protein [Betaproteobacteria bacterium]
MSVITYDDFKKVEMRVGRIIKAEPFPKARKRAYKLLVDFGEHGLRKSSAQITKLYSPDELVGKLVIAVTNFPPRQVADFMSEVLVLGVALGDESEVALIQPDREVPLGQRVF